MKKLLILVCVAIFAASCAPVEPVVITRPTYQPQSVPYYYNNYQGGYYSNYNKGYYSNYTYYANGSSRYNYRTPYSSGGYYTAPNGSGYYYYSNGYYSSQYYYNAPTPHYGGHGGHHCGTNYGHRGNPPYQPAPPAPSPGPSPTPNHGNAPATTSGHR